MSWHMYGVQRLELFFSFHFRLWDSNSCSQASTFSHRTHLIELSTYILLTLFFLVLIFTLLSCGWTYILMNYEFTRNKVM